MQRFVWTVGAFYALFLLILLAWLARPSRRVRKLTAEWVAAAMDYAQFLIFCAAINTVAGIQWLWWQASDQVPDQTT